MEGTLLEGQNDAEEWEQFSAPASMSAPNRSPTTYDTLLDKLQSLGQLLNHDNPENEAIVKAARHYTNEQVEPPGSPAPSLTPLTTGKSISS